MKFSFLSGEWKERLTMLYSLPFSNWVLRFFPPKFTFRDPILSLVKKHRKKGSSCGLLLFYLEDFHHLFTTYPHEATIELKAKIRQTLLQILPSYFKSKDILGVCEYGNQDICIFIKDYPGFHFDELQKKGMFVLLELQKQLRKSQELYSKNISFQMGSSIIGTDIENTSAAIENAYHYAHSIATKKLPQHFNQTRSQLLEILNRENISVLAQPIMNLSSGDIFGWEILTRGPQNSPFYTPTELFELAYQADLLTKMEFLVLKKAFHEISDRSIKEQVFLNVTPVSLSHPLFLQRLLELLSQYPSVAPSQIVLEITERHAIRDFQHMGEIMAVYRSHGFRFAVDDAGAGYSSLQSISELIPDIIKIDRSVIQNIDQVMVKQSLLKALLHFAKNINCEVIAEGVERQEEVTMLYELDVNMVQGFYFAHPQPLVTDQERVQQLKLVKEKIEKHHRVHTA